MTRNKLSKSEKTSVRSATGQQIIERPLWINLVGMVSRRELNGSDGSRTNVLQLAVSRDLINSQVSFQNFEDLELFIREQRNDENGALHAGNISFCLVNNIVDDPSTNTVYFYANFPETRFLDNSAPRHLGELAVPKIEHNFTLVFTIVKNIAIGLALLHHNHYVYGNLSLESVVYDPIRGDVCLIDCFGLRRVGSQSIYKVDELLASRVLPPEWLNTIGHSKSGNAIPKQVAYTQATDVFQFSLLLNSLFQVNEVYAHLDDRSISQITSLIERGINQKPKVRPRIAEFATLLISIGEKTEAISAATPANVIGNNSKVKANDSVLLSQVQENIPDNSRNDRETQVLPSDRETQVLPSDRETQVLPSDRETRVLPSGNNAKVVSTVGEIELKISQGRSQKSNVKSNGLEKTISSFAKGGFGLGSLIDRQLNKFIIILAVLGFVLVLIVALGLNW